MKKEDLEKFEWEDQYGEKYFPTYATYYPRGAVDKMHLENEHGVQTWIRFNQEGAPIAGNLDLQKIEKK